MSINEQFCKNCIYFKCEESWEEDGYKLSCTSQSVKLFKTIKATPEGYCVNHELDPNKKPQKTGKL